MLPGGRAVFCVCVAASGAVCMRLWHETDCCSHAPLERHLLTACCSARHAMPPVPLPCPQIQAAEEARTQAEQAQSAAEAECGTLRRQLAAAEGRLSLVDGLEAEAAEAKQRVAAAEQQAAELEEQLAAARAEAQAQQSAAATLRDQLEEAQAGLAAAKAAAEEAEARR